MATLQKIAAQNYTAEQVGDIIEKAWQISADYDGDAEDRRCVFEQACQLLGQQSATFVAENPIPNFAFPNGLPR